MSDPTGSEELRAGPKVRIVVEASCEGCKFHRSEYYCVEDGNDVDSGFTHSCDFIASERIRNPGGRPPKECPFLALAETFAHAKLILTRESKEP